MADEMLRRNLDRAFDPGADFPDRLLLSRTMAMLDVPSTTERRLRWRQPQALTLVAALLAITIVATLLFAAHQRQTAPAKPGPYRAIPYTIPSPPTVASSCGSVPRPWATSPPNVAKMVTTTTGWAYGPMRSADGGAHWLDVSPPSIPDRTPKNDEFFLDATHAWVAETARSPNPCVVNVVIFSTADGGRTWQRSTPIPVRFSVPTDVIWTGAANHAGWFYFVDAQHGWLLLGSGPAKPVGAAGVDPSWIGADWRVGDLYGTTDGGLNWTLAATYPVFAPGCIPAELNGTLHESPMSFSSPTTGWIVSTCGLLVTHDGGLTWSKSITPLAPREAPVFFDPSHGLIFADGGLLVTSDGGSSWSVRATLPANTYAVEFTSPSEGWAAAAKPSAIQCGVQNLDDCNGNFQLYRTSDGGKTWVPGSTTSFMLPAPKYWPPAYLHFVDSKVGFLDPGGPVEGLFKTADGGRTWTAVNGTVQRP